MTESLPGSACYFTHSVHVQKHDSQTGEALNFLLLAIVTGIAAFLAYFGNGPRAAHESRYFWAFGTPCMSRVGAEV